MVYDKVTLPGDSHVALLLRMTEYFVRNITSVCLLKSNSTIYILSLRYPVQRTLCHCEAPPTAMPWQSPGREPYYKTHARYFCTCVEKKAHTNKRVSIIACNNVISKVQLSGTPRDTVYPWGKGANKHKSEHCRPDNAISTAQFAPVTLYEFW